MKIAPSILSADFWNLSKDIQALTKCGINMLHFDVMDGHFVPNLSFGVPVLKSLRPRTDMTLDVHLMITDPFSYIKPFCEAGADSISFHVESCSDTDKTISEIQRFGKKAALVLKPGTPAEAVFPYLDRISMVLVMTVEPGFGGQTFMVEMLDKVRTLKSVRPSLTVQVDGGINEHTVGLCREAGVDICVAGSGVFCGKSIASSLKKLGAL